jgi:hypothetical protein
MKCENTFASIHAVQTAPKEKKYINKGSTTETNLPVCVDVVWSRFIRSNTHTGPKLLFLIPGTLDNPPGHRRACSVIPISCGLDGIGKNCERF